MLGTGWYNCHTAEVWDFTTAPWRHQPKLLLQLHLTLADGSERVLVSDAGWKVGTGPLVFDGLRNGETYDARLEIPGWAEPGFDDSGLDAGRPHHQPGRHARRADPPLPGDGDPHAGGDP